MLATSLLTRSNNSWIIIVSADSLVDKNKTNTFCSLETGKNKKMSKNQLSAMNREIDCDQKI